MNAKIIVAVAVLVGLAVSPTVAGASRVPTGTYSGVSSHSVSQLSASMPRAAKIANPSSVRIVRVRLTEAI